MFQKPPQFVAIQRPTGIAGEFTNVVYEVELEPLVIQKGSFVLKKINETHQPYTAGLPFLHKGFFDSHLHVSGISWAKENVDLQNTANPVALVERLQNATPNNQGFVSGFGWNESDWKTTNLDLNKVFHNRLPEHAPIYAKRICAHSALVNEAFKKWINEADLPTFVTDKDLILIESKLAPIDKFRAKKWILEAQDQLIARNITAVGDMSLDAAHVDALKDIAAEGLLKIDFQGVIDAGKVPELERTGPQTFTNTNDLGPLGRPAQVQLRHWKKYLDGSFGSRTAWLSTMYSDQESFGESIENLDVLVSQSNEALKKGFYLSFHTIGDASLDQAIRLGEKLFQKLSTHSQLSGDSQLKASTHRLEHAQMIRADQILQLQRQNFWTLCLQPHHRLADQSFIRARLGERRLNEEAYRLASLIRNGISVTLSSDAPIDDFTPLKVIEACLNDSRADEKLTFEEILWNYTTGSRLRLGLAPGLIELNATVFLTPYM